MICCGCGGGGTASAPAKPAPAKIVQFYAADRKIPRGMTGNICYGVEHAAKVELNPPVEVVWPAAARCIEVSPKQNTTYTLTAIGEDGSRDVKTVDVTVGSAPPRLYDLSVNSVLVRAGEPIVVCFKVENTKNVKAGPGHFNPERNCLSDNPKKTTVYKITAYGGDNQIDTGTVTVKVK
jgi:hypothetical protein